MRAVRVLVVAATVLAGLAVAGRSEAAIAYFDETAPASAAYGGGSGRPLVGDFNADGRSDVFVYLAGSGAEVLKLGRADRTFTTVTAGIGVAGTFQPLVGDFDGNGATDIFWYGPGTTADRLWLFNARGGHTSTAKVVSGSFQPLVGDFASTDAAARTDIFWYAPGAPGDFLWTATGGGNFASTPKTVGGTYQNPFVGSFTPDPGTGGSTDATLDIFWYGTSTGSPHRLWKGDGSGGFSSTPIGGPVGSRPVVGFFDGYGVQDIIWNRPSGPDLVWLADPDTKSFTPFDVDIPGDVRALVVQYRVVPEVVYFWNATGADAIWFPNGEPGTWSYDDGPQGNTDMGAGYQPVTGDYDGDGSTDIYWIKPGAGAEKVWYGPDPEA